MAIRFMKRSLVSLHACAGDCVYERVCEGGQPYLLVDPLRVGVVEENKVVSVTVEQGGGRHDNRMNSVGAEGVVTDGERVVRTVVRCWCETSECGIGES